jgi:hypothetical protein
MRKKQQKEERGQQKGNIEKERTLGLDAREPDSGLLID